MHNDITLTGLVSSVGFLFGLAMSEPMSESNSPSAFTHLCKGLKEKLTELAEREHRSLNKQIEFLLYRCIREDADSGAGESELARSAHGKRK